MSGNTKIREEMLTLTSIFHKQNFNKQLTISELTCLYGFWNKYYSINPENAENIIELIKNIWYNYNSSQILKKYMKVKFGFGFLKQAYFYTYCNKYQSKIFLKEYGTFITWQTLPLFFLQKMRNIYRCVKRR
jgi:hypothetical protein